MGMSRCHICGKLGPYSEMVDHTVYSAHPKCEHGLSSLLHNVKEFRNCSVCQKSSGLSKLELRTHLINSHSKEAMADLLVENVK
jgi:hypothetical protein